MAGNFLNSTGQLSIEFALILIVMILYITTLIQPNILIAEKVSKETFGLGYTTLAAEKIVSTIDFVQSSGAETRQTINIFIPNGGNLACVGFGPTIPDEDENKISIKFTLSSGFSHDQCPISQSTNLPTCEKTFKPKTNAGLYCSNLPPDLGGPAHLNIRVSKISSDPVEPIEVRILAGS